MPVLFSLQLDPENTGFIGVETFASLVHSHELPLDPAKLDMLVALAQGNDEGQVCYQELVDLVSAGVTRWWERVGATLCGVGWGGVGWGGHPPVQGCPQLAVAAVATGSLRRSAASARAASNAPSPTGSEPCPGMGSSMRPGWASTSASFATWLTRSCPARWTGAGTSISTARVPRLSSWQLSPSPRCLNPAAVWCPWGLRPRAGWVIPNVMLCSLRGLRPVVEGTGDSTCSAPIPTWGSPPGRMDWVTLAAMRPCPQDAQTRGEREGCPQW